MAARGSQRSVGRPVGHLSCGYTHVHGLLTEHWTHQKCRERSKFWLLDLMKVKGYKYWPFPSHHFSICIRYHLQTVVTITTLVGISSIQGAVWGQDHTPFRRIFELTSINHYLLRKDPFSDPKSLQQGGSFEKRFVH